MSSQHVVLVFFHAIIVRGLCSLVVLSMLAPVPSQAGGVPPVMRMAYLQNDLHHLPFWVGLDKGFFTKEGIAINVRGIFRSGPELMMAFGAGELDAAYVGEAPAAIAALRGTARVQLLAQVNTEGSALVGNKNPKTEKDKALIVAVPGTGSVQDLLLRKALPVLGLEQDNVEIIVIGPPEMSPSLMTKKIDAFVAWEPYPAQALEMGAGQTILTSGSIWPNHPCCALIISEKTALEKPEVARALLRAHLQATEYIAKHPEEAVRIAIKHTGMEEKIVKRALRNVKYVSKPDVPGLEDYLSFLNRLGFVKLENPQEFSRRFIASRFWETDK